MTTTMSRPLTLDKPVAVKPRIKTRITLFHCFNALDSAAFLDLPDCDVQAVNLPCSSLTREVVLLKAFEAGADSVVVLVCPENACRYVQGNIRTRKRVARVKKIMDEIGLDGRRLNIFSIPHGDRTAVRDILEYTRSYLDYLGPNPVR